MSAMASLRPAGPASTMPRRVSGLERAAVALLLLAAAFPRARDVDRPFDRHFEGYQGAFFTTAAINYERLGFGAFSGYPVMNVDVEPGSDPSTWYLYPNHPPLVPWATWLAAETLGPAGWDEAWRAGLPPEGVEPAVRVPFLLANLLGALALWWAVRQAGGIQQALLALALYAVLPLPALYGTLVNYENPSLAGVLLAYGFYARWVRGGGRASLLGLAASFALAGAFTYAPAFFVPPLALHALTRRGWRGAAVAGAAAAGGVLLPLALHAVAARAALAELGVPADGLATRIGRLVGPMFDGSLPFGRWLELQLERGPRYFTLPMCLVALAGLAWTFRPGRERGTAAPVALGPPLALGGLLVLAGYYRHTFDDPPQDPFLLNVAPAVAVLGAAALNALSRPLYRLRGGIAPLVVATGLVAMPALLRMDELRREWRLPGPLDAPAGAAGAAPGPAHPLPSTVGRELRELLPRGSVGLHPAELAYNHAVSFYAWRTLLGVTPAATGPGSYEHADALLASIGLAGAPRYLVLPKRVPRHAAAAVADARERVAPLGPPALETERWEAWRF